MNASMRWAVLAASIVCASCQHPAFPPLSKELSSQAAVDELTINGRALAVPLAFQPFRPAGHRDSVSLEHIATHGVRLYLDLQSSETAATKVHDNCIALLPRLKNQPQECDDVVLIEISGPRGFSDRVYHSDLRRVRGLRNIGTIYGIKLFTSLPMQNSRGGHARVGDNVSLWPLWLQSINSDVPTGVCMIAFSERDFLRFAEDNQKTRDLVDSATECAIFRVFDDGQVSADLVFREGRLGSWAVLNEKSRKLVASLLR